ncbi:MAG: membrane protein insertase YidC, partial [Burkholderiaceae bacterium]
MDIQRTVLWVVFSMSILFLWDNWMRDHGHSSMFFPSANQQAKPNMAGGVKSDLPKASGPAATTTATAAANAVPNGTTPVKSEIITITTDLFKADIDTIGGELKRLELLQHKSGTDQTKNEVLFDVGPDHMYLAQTGLIGGTADAAFPNHKSGFIAKPGPRSLDGANQVQLVLESEQSGVKLTKTYTFKRGDYVIDIKHDVTN